MTFWQYLKRQQRRDDPVGDFARDVMADRTFPRLATRRVTFARHLAAQQPCDGARSAFERAYREWSGNG